MNDQQLTHNSRCFKELLGNGSISIHQNASLFCTNGFFNAPPNGNPASGGVPLQQYYTKPPVPPYDIFNTFLSAG